MDKQKLNILYIHSVAEFGGASRSLFELLNAFPEGTVEPIVLLPSGSAADVLQNMACKTVSVKGVSKFDFSEASYYKGLRWLILLRELYFLPFTIMGLWKAKKTYKDIDIIHVNDVFMPISIILAKWLFKKPLIMHVRAVVKKGDKRFRIKLLKKLIDRFVDVVIPIDKTVQKSLPTGVTSIVIHNGFSVDSALNKLSNNTNNSPSWVKDNKQLTIGFVGNFLKSKGIYELIEAANICKSKKMDIQFVLAGGNAHKMDGFIGRVVALFGFRHNVKKDIDNLINRYELNDIVHQVGFNMNVKNIYDNIDVLCFPSHLNAVGRPIFEAAFSKKPSIVAVDMPLDDTIIPYQTGISIEKPEPQAIADAIEYFYQNPQRKIDMGEKAYALALENFDIYKNAINMLSVYHKLINTPSINQ